jgi:hypothetical protein
MDIQQQIEYSRQAAKNQEILRSLHSRKPAARIQKKSLLVAARRHPGLRTCRLKVLTTL